MFFFQINSLNEKIKILKLSKFSFTFPAISFFLTTFKVIIF